MNAIADFLKPFKPLMDAHVVNFFKDRLWESIVEEWMDCLHEESVENLVNIPSGIAMNHSHIELDLCGDWRRIIGLLHSRISYIPYIPSVFLEKPSNYTSVLSQGMNPKKKHEVGPFLVEILSAVISKIADNVGSRTIIDVGSGQGYLAQVLSFLYQLAVVAIDASSHHGSVTMILPHISIESNN
ncbi:hypothetical protein QJS10_CPA01g00838 [Acorus calamus]|uniref:Methyltransferase domain-containing protein n=1 Tax=Acorus calamus TaxID=4465 RepID=A0AAV9FJF4_ACOCL|nr:hypothetical protein QJS10_CPA01g00838 [Acorus calamus]